MTSRFPPRLHVLLASHAPIGLVIRRGPSKSVASILWDRRRDEFTLGQWLKGRIYERRCDLSPDGKFFLYFAMNGRWESEAKGSWTAISRAPYLKALAIFPKGDCWHGGGMWTGKSNYWLNDGYGHQTLRNTSLVRRDTNYQPSEYFGGECPGVYYIRLMRDGWLLKDMKQKGSKSQTIFEKPVQKGWTLRKIAHEGTRTPEGKGCYWDEHELVREPSGVVKKFASWEWADRDGERLVWASDGKIFSATLTRQDLINPTELIDLNAWKFTAVEAPY